MIITLTTTGMTQDDIANALHDAAERVERGIFAATIYDDNGNRTGSWELNQ